MDLKILLPFRVFSTIENVQSIVCETGNGSYGLLPQRLDCIAALVPSILSYETETGDVYYLAVDKGLLVKTGPKVMVSVRNAFGGTDLGKLHELVEKEFKTIGDTEKNMRSVMAKLESGFIHNLEKLGRD